jgi:hypothetical protein
MSLQPCTPYDSPTKPLTRVSSSNPTSPMASGALTPFLQRFAHLHYCVVTTRYVCCGLCAQGRCECGQAASLLLCMHRNVVRPKTNCRTARLISKDFNLKWGETHALLRTHAQQAAERWEVGRRT